MGMFDFLGKKNNESLSEVDMILDSDKNPDVVIPQHAKLKEEKSGASEKRVSKSVFVVNGVYAIGGEVMLSGSVKSGLIKKKMKTKVNDKESVVLGLKIGTNNVQQLNSGDEGTIFVKGKNLFLVKNGDLLEFK